jgi:hypothetical protein
MRIGYDEDRRWQLRSEHRQAEFQFVYRVLWRDHLGVGVYMPGTSFLIY